MQTYDKMVSVAFRILCIILEIILSKNAQNGYDH